MDSALDLRKRVDRGETLSDDNAVRLLDQSILVARLLMPPKGRPETFSGLRAYEWRMLELCEIPFAYLLPQAQNWLDLLVEKTAIPEGFSLTGEKNGVLGCHTSLLTRIMIAHHADRQVIDRGIEWLLEYQMLNKGDTCAWPGTDLYTRWGGCMKNTPCYYGIVKAMVTLQLYQETFGVDASIEEKLEQGIEAMLERELFKRHFTGEPIEPSIIENFFPYPYKSNLIEMLTIIKKAGKLEDERCQPALQLLMGTRREDGTFQADKVFMQSAWVLFDPLKKSGEWITYIVEKILEN